MSSAKSKKPILAALFANFVIFVSKLITGLITGSTAMLSESAHSFADTFNQIFLLVGLYEAQKKPDKKYPFGRGRARFFWSFITALMMWTVGAFFSIYEGIKRIIEPQHLESGLLASYIVLLVAFIFEMGSLILASRVALLEARDKKMTFLKFLEKSSDTTLKTVLFEDTAATIGIIFAALGLMLSSVTHNPIFDGISSIAIGIVLFAVALFMARESYHYLLGRSAGREIESDIFKVVKSFKEVRAIIDLKTLYMGPNSILVYLEVNFTDNLSVDDIENSILEIEKSIKKKVPSASYISIESRTHNQ